MSALDDAINSPSPVWLTPKVQTDWAKNGYDGDNTVDDLSEQLGDAFTVSHSIEDALPEPVTSTGQNDASGTLSAPDMVGKTVNGVPFDARQYFSPFNTASPVYGYDRDVAPVTLDFGTLTSAGPDYRRLFTGQMANVAISGRLAELP